MCNKKEIDQHAYPIHKEVAFVSVSKKSKVKLFLLIYTIHKSIIINYLQEMHLKKYKNTDSPIEQEIQVSLNYVEFKKLPFE